MEEKVRRLAAPGWPCRGCADPRLLKQASELRPDALFIKPFDPEQLLKWLEGCEQ